MTMEEYQKRRKWQDRKDRKKFEKMILAGITLLVFTGIGIGLLGMVMAVIGG